MPEPTPEAWAQIRHDYEHTDKPLAHICADHEITVPMLRYRMKRWEWTRRKPLIPHHGPPAVALMAQASSPGEAQRNPGAAGEFAPDFASLHPGYDCPDAPFHPTPPAFADAAAGDPRPPEPAPGRAQARPGWEGNERIVPRLQSAAAQLLGTVESVIARLASGELRWSGMEQAGRTLGTLTRALRELNGLLLAHNARLDAAPPEDDPVPEDIDELRYELARRIRGFIEARQNEKAALAPGAGPGPQNDG